MSTSPSSNEVLNFLRIRSHRPSWFYTQRRKFSKPNESMLYWRPYKNSLCICRLTIHCSIPSSNLDFFLFLNGLEVFARKLLGEQTQLGVQWCRSYFIFTDQFEISLTKNSEVHSTTPWLIRLPIGVKDKLLTIQFAKRKTTTKTLGCLPWKSISVKKTNKNLEIDNLSIGNNDLTIANWTLQNASLKEQRKHFHPKPMVVLFKLRLDKQR